MEQTWTKQDLIKLKETYVMSVTIWAMQNTE